MFANSLKTGMLMFALIMLFTTIGGLLGNSSGALIGLLIAGGMSFFSYWFSDKMVLSAYNGKEVTELNNPRLYRMVKNLAANAKLPMPKVYIIPERQPNAFATGRNPQHAAVACTEGLLEIMNDNELAGVLGHELGHVKHRETQEDVEIIRELLCYSLFLPLLEPQLFKCQFPVAENLWLTGQEQNFQEILSI